MKITSIKCNRISASDDLFAHLESSLPENISEHSVMVISSKIISLCEGSFVVMDGVDKDTLIKQEAEQYLERSFVPGEYLMHTMKNNMIMPSAGIDGSNGGENYVLLPQDSYQSAKQIHEWLAKEYNLKNIGIIITDSRSTLLRKGVVGYALGYYGFNPIRNYRGTQDLFDRMMHFSQSNIVDALAAAAVVDMGEGNESTPIAIIEDVKNIEFGTHYSKGDFEIHPDEDMYMPFYKNAPWKKNQ